MKNKSFDCVELQHQGGARLGSILKGKSKEQIRSFWEKNDKSLRDKQLTLKTSLGQVN